MLLLLYSIDILSILGKGLSELPENPDHGGANCPRFPEGSRELRFPDYVTMAQDCYKIVTLTHRPLLPPENTPSTHFC